MELPLWVILDLIEEDQPYVEATLSLELPQVHQKQAEVGEEVEPKRVVVIEL